jgi:hypothetical protein
MRRPLPSLLAALALAALAALLAACGDSDDDTAETTAPPTTAAATTSSPTTDASSDDTGSTGGQTEDVFVDQLVELGFEQEEAACLADELLASGIDAAALEELAEDPGQVLGAFQACDIPLTRILEVAGELGVTDSSDPGEVLEQAIVQALGSDVVSQEQASCIADELVGQGRDVAALADLDALAPILEGCGVSLSDIGG